jgi:hypothetical protein
VTGSNFTLTGLRFTGTVSGDYALTTLAGALLRPGMAPQQVTNIRIEGNVFALGKILQDASALHWPLTGRI